VTYPQQPGQYPGQQPGQYPGPDSGGVPAQYPGTGPDGMPAQQYPGTGPDGMPAQQYPGTGPGGMPAQPYPGGGMPQYPGAPGAMPPYPAGGYGQDQQRPSGGTAITAGVLACLGAVWAIIAALINVSTLDAISGSSIAWVVWMQIIVMVIEVLTLAPGAVMLFRRMAIGRWLIAAGCALHIIQGIVAIAAIDSSGLLDGSDDSAAVAGGSAVGGIVVLLPAIATLVLVLVPLTAKWCAWGKPAAVTAQPTFNQQPPQQQW
jgi:hypothetical protein